MNTMRMLMIVKLALLVAIKVSAQNVAGDWHGQVQAGTVTVGFVFTIEAADDGLSGSMAIPARNIKNLKAQKTTFENGELLIDGSNFGWRYKAIYDAEEQVFKGTFKEGVNELELNLEKGKGVTVERNKRPQEPTGHLPYQTEEVQFQNAVAGIKLAGTLTMPPKAGKAAVAILITGSGPQNRDEEIYGHKPFLVLADHLTRQGIAVLRYDDRGVNDSEGDFARATTADFATDLQAAVDYLKTREDIDPQKIGLIGHSEGGIIAPIVAANSPKDIAFLVSLAGTAVPGYETSRLQAITMAKGQIEDLDAYDQFIRRTLDIASADKDIEEVRSELADHYRASDFFNNSIPAGTDPEVVLKSLIEVRTNAWVRYFYDYNPADMFRKVKSPVLHINGSKDIQVLAKPNQDALKKALKKARHKDYTITELPGMNHFFQEAETGAMSEYASIDQTFSPKALQLVSDWILERVK